LCGIISTVAVVSDSGISHSSSGLEADALVVIVVVTAGLHLGLGDHLKAAIRYHFKTGHREAA
jgi:hypothetical protein